MSVWLQIVSSIVSLAIGIGVAWGAMRANGEHVSNKVDKLGEKLDTFGETLTEVRIDVASLKATQRASKAH